MEQTINQITQEGIDKGYAHADREWRTMALECVKQIALRQETFTMNDVRWMIDASPIKTHDKRAVGGIAKTALKLGWITPTGASIVSRVGNKSLLQVWKSKIYKPKETLF